jgi:GT2 family glycosyltransferase
MARKRQIKQKSIQSLVDIVIICGGRFDMLRKCLKALEEQVDAPPFQVFVVDNATENHERLHNKDIFEMPIITESKRLTQEEGFPRANNGGAKMGNSPLILFLNDDVQLQPNALMEASRTMDNPDVGIVGIKLLFPLDSTSPTRPAGKVQHVGIAFNINGDPIHPLMAWSADHPKCCVTRDVQAVTGAFLMVRRNLFKQIGGFWEGYGPGTFEDIDLCLSVKYLGKKIVVNTNTFGYHYVGATVEKKQRAFPLQQNSLMFRARWAQVGIIGWDYTFY